MTDAILSDARRAQITDEIYTDADAECSKAEVREAVDRLLKYDPPIEDLEAAVRREFDASDVSIRTLGDGPLTIADVDEQLTDGEAVVMKTRQTEGENARAVVAGVFKRTDPSVKAVLGKVENGSGWRWHFQTPGEVERFDAADIYIRCVGTGAELEKVTESVGDMITETKTIGRVKAVKAGALVSPEEYLPDAGGVDT